MSKDQKTNPRDKKNNPQIPSAKGHVDSAHEQDAMDGAENSSRLDIEHKPPPASRMWTPFGPFLHFANSWIMVVLTGVLAFYTALLSVYTKDMADTNRVIAAANVKAAVATESSAVATRRTIEITERLARIQIQPEVGYKEISRPDLIVDKEFRCDISIENTGQSPALDFSPKYMIALCPRPQVDSILQDPIYPVRRENTLPRGTTLEVSTAIPGTLSQTDVNAVRDGNAVICLRLVMEYSDAWKEQYRREYRFTYLPWTKQFILYLGPPSQRRARARH